MSGTVATSWTSWSLVIVCGALACSRPASEQEVAGGTGSQAGSEAPVDDRQALPGARNRARVFISGHSLLEAPIPEDIALIARSLGDDYKYGAQNVFGSTLAARSQDAAAELRKPRHLAEGERYDTLLVTERHDLPWSLHAEGTIPTLRRLHDRLVEGNPQATTLFTHVWLSLDGDDPGPWMAYERAAQFAWECAASKVNLTLAQAGRSDRVVPAPGATALVDLVQEAVAGRVAGLPGETPRQRLDALFKDDVHLTDVGAYFMAAVHYAAIFRKSPVGASAPGPIAPALAGQLQEIAWRHVRAHDARRPDAGARPMEQCRARLQAEICPAFWRHTTGRDSAGAWFGRRWQARLQASLQTRRFCRYTDLDWEPNPLR